MNSGVQISAGDVFAVELTGQDLVLILEALASHPLPLKLTQPLIEKITDTVREAKADAD